MCKIDFVETGDKNSAVFLKKLIGIFECFNQIYQSIRLNNHKNPEQAKFLTFHLPTQASHSKTNKGNVNAIIITTT
ncbi:hypothetical protein AVL56_11250 [Alteromonas stellipolaris]|nr:hypothetical protein AVL56_11250 [Alteromonas stellipolaris]